MLLACYLMTLAPGVTFWDAGEFIAAAHGLGIPHPPGTPLYVALGRTWTLALSPVADAARAMNLLSAVSTALAGAIMAWLVADEVRTRPGAVWGATAGALSAGLMATAWANATETEVYAVSLLHVVLLLACAARAGAHAGGAGRRWLACAAYLIALAPALHLSVLVAVPAAIALAARGRDGAWSVHRALALGGVLLTAAGVGRVSLPLVIFGAGLVLAAGVLPWSTERDRGLRPRRDVLVLLSLVALAASALVVILVRAAHDPALNQGNPATLAAFADVVARRQYSVASLLPRQAPVWLQLANIAQYADWQIALGWGRGIFTTPVRVVATLTFVLLGAYGTRALRRDAARMADALLLLLLCGTLGVAAYLNLKAGTSLGWGVIPDSMPHEARERDYFFVIGFWAWGCLAGYGGFALARARRWPAPVALCVVALPLVGNWRAVDRSREPRASAAHRFASALLGSAPPRAVLFVAGDNDTYPLWYAQQVERQRPDITLVTVSLLPAEWYQAELTRRSGLRWRDEQIAAISTGTSRVVAQLAAAARRAGRPVVASPALTAAERAVLGGDWRLEGVLYRSHSAGDGSVHTAGVDTVLTAPAARVAPAFPRRDPPLVDDIAGTMLTLLACPRLGQTWTADRGTRDSLEVKCNLR